MRLLETNKSRRAPHRRREDGVAGTGLWGGVARVSGSADWGLSGALCETLPKNKPRLRGLGPSLGSAATGRAVCLRAGSFPSLGLRCHICTMGLVAMTIFRRLPTPMFQKYAHESVILILRSLLNVPTGEGLVYAFIQYTFIEHLLCTRELEVHRVSRQTVSVPSWNLHSSV